MYAYVAIATGWTWEYIGRQLTLPRLFAMYRIWRKYPPVNVTAALFAGIPSEATPPAKLISQADVAKAMTADPRKLKWITVPNEARNG